MLPTGNLSSYTVSRSESQTQSRLLFIIFSKLLIPVYGENASDWKIVAVISLSQMGVGKLRNFENVAACKLAFSFERWHASE